MSSSKAAHNDEMIAIVKKSLSELKSVKEILGLCLTIPVLLLFKILPGVLSLKLGLSKPDQFKLKRVITKPEIWLGKYLAKSGVEEPNCVIIKGKDGTLLMRSPPPLTPEIQRTIEFEGKPCAILVSSAHDTFADQWKQAYPDLVVLAPQAEREVISNRVQVTHTLEDVKGCEALFDNFYIVKSIPFNLDNSGFRFADNVLELDLGSGKRALSLTCGFVNNKVSYTNPRSYLKLIQGTAGLRLLRQFSYLFMEDLTKCQSMWRSLATDTPELRALLPLHGDELISDDVASMMMKVPITRSRFY